MYLVKNVLELIVECVNSAGTNQNLEDQGKGSSAVS